MQGPIARVIFAVALLWVSAALIHSEIRTPKEPIFDFSVLCTVLGGIVFAATILFMLYASVRLLAHVRGRARDVASPQPKMVGPVMRANILLALAWVAAAVIGWSYLTPPYVRLVPEPSAPIPVGETATFTVETDFPAVAVFADRAYRLAGECGTDDTGVLAEDGDHVTIEACRPGIGTIRIGGGGDALVNVRRAYEFGEPAGGVEVAHHEKFQFADSATGPGRPVTVLHNAVYHQWHIELDGGGIDIKAVDWINRANLYSQRMVIPISFFYGEVLPLDDYYLDIFDNTGEQIVRLDFAEARRIPSNDAPSAVLYRLDLRPRRSTFLFQWGPCERPWPLGGISIAVSLLKKSPTYMLGDVPSCSTG